MGILDKLLGGAAAAPVDAVGNALDKLFTSDDEKAQAAAVMAKIRQQPHILQAEINKIEAGHRSTFVAGWRPFIGWVCGVGLLFPFVINPCFQWYTSKPGPEMPTEALISLIMALLGLGTLRTVEKLQGRAK
tara:strand:- start:564 stop:959 length:396 start_codon:yes stop_codon:yes gene_type:complete